MAVSGLGALAGGLLLASRKSVLGLGRLMVLMITLLGVVTIGVACTNVLEVSLVLVTLIGFAVTTVAAASNTVLQTIVDEDKRGRATSLYMMAFMGAARLEVFWQAALPTKSARPGPWRSRGSSAWPAPWHLPSACPPCEPAFTRFTCEKAYSRRFLGDWVGCRTHCPAGRLWVNDWFTSPRKSCRRARRREAPKRQLLSDAPH